MNGVIGTTTGEQVWAAVLALMDTLKDTTTQPVPVGKVRYTSRRVRHWQEMEVAEQPCILIGEDDDEGQKPQLRGEPYKWTLHGCLYVYAYTGEDESSVPTTQLNGILEAIKAVIAPSAREDKQSLGGLVFDCRIIGKIKKDGGVLGAQAVAIVPLEIVV
jgi:hypothetical protein